jgi:hypothetical protein
VPVPKSIVAGDSVGFTIISEAYGPANYDECSFVLASGIARVTSPGEQGESDDSWVFNLTPAQTGPMTVGNWSWYLQASVVLPPQRVTFDKGVLVVERNPGDGGIVVPPGDRAQTLEAARETLRKLVSNEVESVSFLNQTWKRWDIEKLQRVIRDLEREAEDEEAPPGANPRLVYTRFRRMP